MKNQIAAIILAAGKGTRMKSDLPKVMIPVCGKPMIRHIIDTLEELGVDEITAVIAPDGELVRKEISPHKSVVQEKQLGTGHAVLSAKDALKGFDGVVLVVFGDSPMTGKETFQKAIDKVREGSSVVVLGFRPEDAARYGRLKMSGDKLEKIIEYKDATEEERKIGFCNSGIMAFDGRRMFGLLEKIGSNNAANEYYLTDVIAVANGQGLGCSTVEAAPEEVVGANTVEELALLEELFRKKKKC